MNVRKTVNCSHTVLALAAAVTSAMALAQAPVAPVAPAAMVPVASTEVSHGPAQPSGLALNAMAVDGAASKVVAPTQAITLDEYLRLVLQNNPQLQAERLQVDAARADSKTAAAFPNPSASFYRKPGERGWGIDQPLPIFGQRGLRKENARRAEVTAAAQVDVTLSGAMDEAAGAFIELLMAQQRLAMWQEAQQKFVKAGHVVKGQMDAGTRSRYDGARISLQQAQMDMQVGKAQAELKEASARAAAAAAIPSWAPKATGSLKPASNDMLPSYSVLWDQAQQRLPAVRAAQAELDQARQKVQLQRREALPTPSISLSRVRTAFDGNYNVVGVSVELPLFDRKQGAIERAQVEEQQAELKREATLLSAQADLQRAVDQLALRRTSVINYEREGLVQIAPLEQMAEDAYRLGRGSILELIDAMSSITSHRMEYLDLVKEMLEAEWNVRVASGNLPQLRP
jgi:cobalt-zinc-cadmium efflux system outer membrane protein